MLRIVRANWYTVRPIRNYASQWEYATRVQAWRNIPLCPTRLLSLHPIHSGHHWTSSLQVADHRDQRRIFYIWIAVWDTRENIEWHGWPVDFVCLCEHFDHRLLVHCILGRNCQPWLLHVGSKSWVEGCQSEDRRKCEVCTHLEVDADKGYTSKAFYT